MMKRKGLFFCILLAAMLVCAGVGLADAPIVGTIELSPAFLTSPGKVNVSITISNTTDTDLKDPVVLYDPAAQVVTDFGTNGEALLKTGESLTWTGSYDVNQRTLDNGSVVYFVKYTLYRESGEAVEQSAPIRAKIEQQTAETGIDVKRVISPTVAREDQKVKVDYHITNAGTVSLTNITITENKDIHAKAQTIPELKAGQTADISYPVTMGKKNLTSGATITYQTEGESGKKTYTVEDQVITYGSSDLTATLAASSKGVVQNGLVTLTLTIKNGGSVDISDIRVSDPTLGEVFSNQQVAAGKTLKLEKEITLTATTDYQFTVTSVDSTGAESSTATETVTVTAVNPEDALNLTLVATPDKTEVYGNPATVRFSLQITNDSNVAANKVVILHGATELYQFAAIPAGESRTLTRDTALSMSGKFQFTASAQDPLENTMTFKSNEMQIAVYAPTPEPATPTPAPNPTPEPTFNPATVIPIRHDSIGAVPKMVQSILLPVLIAAGVLLVAACVLLLIATKRRHDQKRASEAAYDHLERVKRRDYVTPAEEAEAAAAQSDEHDETGEKSQDQKKDGGKALTSEEQEAQMANRRLVGEDRPDELDWELPHVKYARNAAQQQTSSESDNVMSALSQGLYDEEMTSDFSDYDAGLDGVSGEVMYEQPSEPAYAEDVPANDGAVEKPAADEAEDDYDNDGYTEDFRSEYGDGDQPSDPNAYDAYAETEDGLFDDAAYTPDDSYTDGGAYGEDDRYADPNAMYGGYRSEADGDEDESADGYEGGSDSRDETNATLNKGISTIDGMPTPSGRRRSRQSHPSNNGL